MKIKSLTIRGFRGFSKEQSIDLHPTLTIIYGPNSYGKTSVTEAVEWLLYGRTSKVDRGESKEEYKGSYRNCHIDSATSTVVKVCFSRDDKLTVFESELVDDEGMNKSVDGLAVEQWPIDADLSVVSKPFIMQHALKYLLLVGPDQRFRGFAQLLGLDELGNVQSDFVSLCTKPESSIPSDVSLFRTRVASIENRLSLRPALKEVYSLYKKGKDSLPSLTTCIWKECTNRVPEGTPRESVLANLLRIRDEAVKKVFPGRITLAPFSADDKTSDSADLQYFVKFASEDLITKYCELVALTTRDTIIKQAEFYNLGVELLKQQPSECPFCGQKLTTTVTAHINNQHKELKEQGERSSSLLNQRQEINDMLSDLKRRLEKCQQRHMSRLVTFLSISTSMTELAKILSPKHEPYIQSVRDAIVQLQKVKNNLDRDYLNVSKALTAVQLSVQQSKEDVTIMKDLGQNLVTYSSQVASSVPVISAFVSPMSDANEILRHELDSAAGTEDIGVLIDLIEKQKEIEKYLEVESILAGLKELRKSVDQYVGSKMLDAVSNEMTADVMGWYDQIRTTGDPDVHFSGFDMDRTKKGEIKSRRVQIKASSYGKDLVSAVSSLSESKLNALGLCLSIATNLKPGCPFGFLFIDDPIQSWDDEHEIQFIDVIRKLVDKGKQVILLSHNKGWLDQVRAGCRSLNGFFYEITSYTKNGPNIAQKPWCSWRQRLDEVDAILKDATADSVRLQHAEEEIRLVVTDLTSALYLNKKGVHKDPNKLNSASVRKSLVECGIPTELTDHISQTFETTDDAHHVTDYVAQRERIRRYYNWAHELAKYVQ